MNQLKKIIQYNHLIPYQKNLKMNQFILSKDKKSSLSFIEITPNQYRFVFDDYDKHMKLNQNMKNLLFIINEESKKNKRISIQNLTWCGGGITIIYDYQKLLN